MKTVPIDVSDADYARLVIIANRRGSTVRQILAGGARRLAREIEIPLVQRVTELHGRGFTVAEMGRELGMTNARIRDAMSRVNLTPNKPGGTRK